MDHLLDKIKEDLKKSFEGGIAVVKQGANVVSKRMTEITEESKRQYRMVDLKFKIERQMIELGGRTYEVLQKAQDPATDKKVKSISAKIKKLEWQLNKLEGNKTQKTDSAKDQKAKGKVQKKSLSSGKPTKRPVAKKKRGT